MDQLGSLGNLGSNTAWKSSNSKETATAWVDIISKDNMISMKNNIYVQLLFTR